MTTRRYVIELSSGIAFYCGLLVISNLVLCNGWWTSSWRVPLVLLPMLGLLGVAIAVVRQLARLDELQRRIQFDVISVAFLGTTLLTLGYGFLEGAGLPRLSMFVVWPIIAALWVSGSVVSFLRYRR